MSQLDEKLALLKSARESLKAHKEAANAALEDFKASDDVYTFNSEEAAKVGAIVADLEESIRALALVTYKESGIKKVHDSVEVKVFPTFKVTDPAKVREWCFKNHPLALKPDMKMVEADAKDGPVDGTETGQEARAQIATKL